MVGEFVLIWFTEGLVADVGLSMVVDMDPKAGSA